MWSLAPSLLRWCNCTRRTLHSLPSPMGLFSRKNSHRRVAWRRVHCPAPIPPDACCDPDRSLCVPHLLLWVVGAPSAIRLRPLRPCRQKESGHLLLPHPARGHPSPRPRPSAPPALRRARLCRACASDHQGRTVLVVLHERGVKKQCTARVVEWCFCCRRRRRVATSTRARTIGRTRPATGRQQPK